MAEPKPNAPIRTWRWEGDHGAEASADVDRDLVIAAWLHADEGMRIDQLDADEIERLRSGMRFHVLHSVVKRDHDHIDPDDCGGWHSEGSGRRTKETWSSTATCSTPSSTAGSTSRRRRPVADVEEVRGPANAPSEDREVTTCLDCRVAWDSAYEPAKCSEDDHRHALNNVNEWNEVGRGRIT